MIYQCLLTQNNFISMEKMQVHVEKGLSVYHFLTSGSLPPWPVSEDPCANKNLCYNSSNFMQMQTVG